MNQFYCLLLLCCAALVQAQESSKPSIDVEGFLDVFYTYDFNRPDQSIRQPFFFNHNRHNEVNINLGLMRVGLDHARYRASFALQAGTYVNDNYAAEPGFLKNIHEAYVGLALDKKGKLWLDAGVLPSHIGFESAVSVDNPNLTRSILAESSPFFETGLRLSYDPSEQWSFALLLMNGWQRIQRVQGNSLPALGTQLVYTPSEKLTLNWSTWLGSEYADVDRRMRYFNNLFAQWKMGEAFELTAGFDFGAEQEAKGSSDYNIWLSPVVIGRYAFNERWALAGRLEYYQDESGVIINMGQPFQTLGLSVNVDYAPVEYVRCRLEARWLNSREELFVNPDGGTSNNVFIGLSVAARYKARVMGE